MLHLGCNTTVPCLLTAVFLAAAGCDRSSEPTQPLKNQGPIVAIDPENEHSKTYKAIAAKIWDKIAAEV